MGALDATGLPVPSVVRMKLFTLDDRLIERRAGALGPDDVSAVRAALARAFGCTTPSLDVRAQSRPADEDGRLVRALLNERRAGR